MKGLKIRKFFIRFFNWEFWPMWIVYIPLYTYYVWLTIKARNPWFWSASNPGIETGGMLGESKMEIFNIMPDHLKPTTILIKSGTSLKIVMNILKEKELSFPVICKPDRGERGFQVAKINNELELENYLEKNKVDYLIQPFCNFPMELGIYYCRFPWEPTGKIFSVVKKEFLYIKGNGKFTLRKLISENKRAVLQWEKLASRFAHKMDEIIPEGELLELESIGNHARGTKFLNANATIDDQLTKVFDEITSQIPGVYFCRYDLRTTSEEDLKQGKNIFIVELNGVGAEPAHIYDPDYKLRWAWRDLINQYKMVYKISVYNHKNGVKYMTTQQVRAHLKMRKAYRILAES
jgi:hypothetical protein